LSEPESRRTVLTSKTLHTRNGRKSDGCDFVIDPKKWRATLVGAGIQKNGFDKQNPPHPERAKNQMDAIL
jgi:hypothetical protein